LPRTGILGGAFNPPHLGHLVCAQEAMVQLELERVLLVPVGEAPHRTIEDDPGAETRLELAELAAAGDPRLSVSRIEVDRPGPSYTADTLELLRAESPAEEHVLILGGDQAARLRSWHRPERVLELSAVAAVERLGWGSDEVATALAGLAGAERVRFVRMPVIEISSSEVRRRAAAGLPIRYLVPDAVGGRIEARGLYRAGERAGARR
jgi:nicotinate-nucleotide adenylyltransferase